MHPNEEIIHAFYTAFGQKDAAKMTAHYDQNATFSDPVFPNLDGEGVRAMWTMLCEAPELKIEVSEVKADDQTGSARWDAWYTFSATGRQVHNIIYARFEFKDGKIKVHNDVFDFWRWSRQALGAPGVVLGWTPFLKSKIQKTASERLAAWRAAKGDVKN